MYTNTQSSIRLPAWSYLGVQEVPPKDSSQTMSSPALVWGGRRRYPSKARSDCSDRPVQSRSILRIAGIGSDIARAAATWFGSGAGVTGCVAAMVAAGGHGVAREKSGYDRGDESQFDSLADHAAPRRIRHVGAGHRAVGSGVALVSTGIGTGASVRLTHFTAMYRTVPSFLKLRIDR